MEVLAKSLVSIFTKSVASIDLQSNEALKSEESNNEDQLLEIHKSFTSSENANLTGVISLKIKTCSIDRGLLSAREIYSSIYVHIQHRNWVTRTNIVRDYQGKSRFDQVKHFPVNVIL